MNSCRVSAILAITAIVSALTASPALADGVGGSGACCLPGGKCIITSEPACMGIGGEYLGDGSSCDDCVFPETGACCTRGGCLELTLEDCDTMGGVFLGIGSLCSEGGCDTGACCLAGGCLDGFTETFCTTSGGVYQGGGTSCSTDPCAAAQGACCVDGKCVVTTENICNVAGGEYFGDDTICDDVTCGPVGACCIPIPPAFGEPCVITTQADCEKNIGGVYLGDGTQCDPGVCDVTGACCFNDGKGELCVVTTLKDCLMNLDGKYLGDGTTCDGDPCAGPVPMGACCFNDGKSDQCMVVDQATCEIEFEGTYIGDDTLCVDDPCAPVGACCIDAPDFGGGGGVACIETTFLDCVKGFGGEYLGDGTLCADGGCDVFGACCFGDDCMVLTPSDCALMKGEYQGDDTTCKDVQCGGPPASCDDKAGPCQTANGTPGCDIVDCCALVCQQDSFCCEVEWDELCANIATGLCDFCGEDAAGSCFEANDVPGCDFDACCNAVCDVDPFCCDVAWDQICVNQAQSICLTLSCTPDAGDCNDANGSPGCNDAACCELVCALDFFCCDTEWDDLCVDQALDICDLKVVCGEGAGPCDEANGTPGCDDIACCDLICAQDDFCCDVEWDQICADAAIEECTTLICECPGDIDDDGEVGPADLAALLADWNTDGLLAVCSTDIDGDGNVGPADLATLLAAWGSCVNNPDACADRVDIGLGAHEFSTLEATTDGVPHAACQFDGQTYEDIWFNFTAPASGLLEVSTCGAADYDTDLVVYGTCDPQDCPPGDDDLLACNDDAENCAGFTSELTVDVVAGTCYKIRVGGWNPGDQGTGVLFLTLIDAPACGPGAGPCDQANGTPGCDDVKCCEIICAEDPFCCDVEWDEKCVAAVDDVCQNPK